MTSSADLLADDQPRPHHYEFVHVVLRAIVFQVGEDLPALATSGRLGTALQSTWEQVGEALPEELRLHAEGLAVEVHDRAVVVRLPRPLHVAEGHLVAAGELGFFVLEHAWTSEGEPSTVITQWTRDSRHLNLGEGPHPDPAAFLDAIERLTSLGV